MDLELRNISGVKHLTLKLKSHSFKLDIKKHNRSFQNESEPYRTIFTQIVQDEHKGGVIDTVTKMRPQKRFIIQYEETDWELLKRLASQLEAIIFVHMEADKPQIGIGTPTQPRHIENTSHFEIKKAVGEYKENAVNFLGWNQLDFVSNVIESHEIYSLCDMVTFNDVQYLVAEKISELYQGILVNKYWLRPQGAFRQNIIYNETLRGVSIEGKVLTVDADKVRLHLSIDAHQNVDNAYWFSYGTLYSAEGHNGAYIMPEQGETVQLYFPDGDEQLAYIRQAIRLSESQNPKTRSPDTKYFETANGKEIKLSPNEFSLTAKHGKVHMTMTDNGGISFVSKSDLLIKASKITMTGTGVRIHAGDSLSLKAGGGNARMDSKVNIKGIEKVVIKRS